MSRPDYAEAVKDAGYGDVSRDRSLCHVQGCPLPGSMSASTSGTSEWFCRCHFGAPATAWADITVRLANREAVLRIGRKLGRSAPNSGVPSEAVCELTALHRADLLTVGGKRIRTAIALGRHVLGVIEQEVRHPELQPQISGIAQFVTDDEVEHA